MNPADRPYQNPPFSGAAEDILVGPERTSILAILALVFSLVCFIPGLGVLGAICGIAALFFISQSRGRLGGMALAVTGLLLGLLISALWIGAGIGIMQVSKIVKSDLVAPMESMLSDIESQNYAGARKNFSEPWASRITDADFDKFREAYRAEFGAFKSAPKTPFEFFAEYGKHGQSMQAIQGRQDSIPLPAIFAKGSAILIYQIEPAKAANRPNVQVTIDGSPKTSGIGNLALKNLQLLSASGKPITLWDSGQALEAVPAPPRAPGSDAAEPTTDDAPPDSAAPPPKDPGR